MSNPRIPRVGLLVAATDRETFMNSPTGSWAIERGIIQLGEIASQLRNRHGDYVEAHPELDPPGMRSARNIVVHGYATIDRDSRLVVLHDVGTGLR